MSKTYPVHAISAVGCVLIRNDEILLVKRKYPPAEGYWAIPGGVIESSELIYEAARRELEEETGLKAEPLGVIALADVLFREGCRVKYRYVIVEVLFDPTSITGSLKPGEEVLDVRWMNIKDVVKRNDITRSTRKLVESILNGNYSFIKIIQVVVDK
ncbi:MAG: NUDIX domain-containing protein [Desulfurococcaceae archaeon]